ncbi:MAG: hypothetical protein ACLTTP_02695, partial [Alistipes ihumii]
LYHTSPERSGVTITTIGRSTNSVIELHGDIVGSCKDVFEFVRSSAFTKIYENLLAQVYKKVPALSDMDFNTVSSRYSKAVILKYITNKKTFQPNHHVLDNPEEKNVMREILIEMENLLFSDSKMKILAINATGDPALDKAKLEGLNAIIKKYIREILLHFNLPFEKESLEPSRKEIIRTAGECFEEITGIKLSELNLNIWVDEFMRNLRDLPEFKGLLISQKSIGYIMDTVAEGIARSPEITDKILYLYLLNNDNSFYKLVCKKLQYFDEKIKSCDDAELRMFTEEFVSEILPMQLEELSNYISARRTSDRRARYAVTRRVVRFYQHDQAHARNRLLQPLRAHDGPHRRDGVQETELERQRNGAARHIALQRIRYGEQGTRDIRRRPHFLDQRTDEQMRRDQFRAARTATHADRDRCEEARIPVP